MYNVPSGEIQQGVLYTVAGTKSVVYNGITYATGVNFRGVVGITTFTFSGAGTELLYEETELKAGSLTFELSYPDIAFPSLTTVLSGTAIEFDLTQEEKVVQELTRLTGMAIELIDYPFYSFVINEERFSFSPD